MPHRLHHTVRSDTPAKPAAIRTCNDDRPPSPRSTASSRRTTTARSTRPATAEPAGPGTAGRPLDPANLTRRFRSFLNRAGLHSTATLLLERGVDLVVIKELLGHAHIGVTAGVYAHVRLRLQRQAIDTLNGALGPVNDDYDDPPAAAGVR
ncbi:tyrosine-type recombinase/integrase [Streptomyces mutabilis]|nr:tyrosine-type recombinase/integrase [Streptomyces mutabilis]MCZ9351002.1 tyrosine-type recombinase/integrase [Streptomyces mutabilis]MCZ9351009.1 tyrosine-type recombinase/integrase [Streptomyces mutabilis]MCZ9351021.1 tyrosine-type recombinase/integrase [Streptomyces mutabilis]